MAGFVKGDIVVVPFPFSDLTAAKHRPAMILAVLPGSDLILCQITSKAKRDQFAVGLDNADLDFGSLNQPSNIRLNRLFTADDALVLKRVAHAGNEKIREVIEEVVAILRG